MVQERRAIITDNVKDFMPLASRAAMAAEHHYGLLFTSDRSMLRRGDAIGRLVKALDGFLRRHEGEEGYRDLIQWLGSEVTG